MTVVPYNLFSFGTPHFRPVDGLGANVAEIQFLFRDIEIQRDHVEQILMVERIFRRVQGHVSHVILVGEHQPWFGSIATFTRALVGRAVVVGFVTLAIKRSGSVQTVLRTRSGHFHAFVYVLARFPVRHQPAENKRMLANCSGTETRTL